MAGQPLSPATDRRLGGPLPRQLANQTRVHLRAINLWHSKSCDLNALCGISTIFTVLFPTPRQVTHALLTRPPLKHLGASSLMSPLDLHVLGTPPAFVLSQDQTLKLKILKQAFACPFPL